MLVSETAEEDAQILRRLTGRSLSGTMSHDKAPSRSVRLCLYLIRAVYLSICSQSLLAHRFQATADAPDAELLEAEAVKVAARAVAALRASREEVLPVHYPLLPVSSLIIHTVGRLWN